MIRHFGNLDVDGRIITRRFLNELCEDMDKFHLVHSSGH